MMDSAHGKKSGEPSSAARKRGAGAKRKPSTECRVNSLDNAFQKYGPQCTDEIAKAMQSIELPSGLGAYVNGFAIRSEERVLERMQHNPDFVQCASWSELLDSKGFRETCNNEIPLALQTIACTEKFPDTENGKGVDFQLLYLNLACMMMGQPVRRMNAATQSVLKQVYEETTSEISKVDQKEDLELLQERMKTMRKPTPSKSRSDSTVALELLFSDPNINPFQLPVEKICSKLP